MEVFTAVVMNVAIFWDIAPCSSCGNRPATRWFPARQIFEPEDGGDTFLRNVGSHTRRYIPEDGNMH
jgi:hypothetical protein